MNCRPQSSAVAGHNCAGRRRAFQADGLRARICNKERCIHLVYFCTLFPPTASKQSSPRAKHLPMAVSPDYQEVRASTDRRILQLQEVQAEYFRRVTAVGYSCVVFGWMTILAVKQPSSKLNLFGVLSLPINFTPFESLIFTSIMVPRASFVGHLSGIVVGYSIAWGLINGMNNYWVMSILGWVVLMFVLSLKRSGTIDFRFIEIESVTDPSLPTVRFVASRSGADNPV